MDTQFIIEIAAKVAFIRDRIQTLEAELAAAKADLVRYETAESVYREFGLEIPLAVGGPTAVSGVPAVKRGAMASLERTITKREKILTFALELMKNGPATTESILDGLSAQGFQVSGEDRKVQLRNISAYLSKAKDEIGIVPTRAGWMHQTFVDAVDANASQPKG